MGNNVNILKTKTACNVYNIHPRLNGGRVRSLGVRCNTGNYFHDPGSTLYNTMASFLPRSVISPIAWN